MKNLWMGLLLWCAGLHASSQHISIADLVGRWESSDGAGLEVVDSSRIFVIYGRQRKPILTYEADFSKSPYWFDFVVKDTAQKLSKMKSLLLLENKDVLKWQVFEDGDRPTDFMPDRGDMIVLRRKK
jgi:hypothetical protein